MEFFMSLFCFFTVISGITGEVYFTTKFFSKAITPQLFGWDEEVGDTYSYQASLLRSPDLPDWIQYVYSRRDRCGYLYGVPPLNHNDTEFVYNQNSYLPFVPCCKGMCPLEINIPVTESGVAGGRVSEASLIEVIAFNRRTYDTARRVIHLNIQETQALAKHQVQLKIDNLNVEDMFEPYRQNKLLDIFRYSLWKDSFLDLHITFMANAVTLGARLPLKPNESEGVVLRIGSSSKFSSNLIDFQEEIRPLWKLQSCDFKRTTVERYFRDEGFALDWCSFKLLNESAKEETSMENNELLSHIHWDEGNKWQPKRRSELPERSYLGEFAVTILVPMLIMVLLVVMLSIILCFQHEGMDQDSELFFQSLFKSCEDYARSKRIDEEPEEKSMQYVAVQKATSTLRSLSRPREVSEVPSAVSGTLPVMNDDDITRPNPPPYSGTMKSTQGEF